MCMLPHRRENYGYVTGKYHEIMELVKKNQKKQYKEVCGNGEENENNGFDGKYSGIREVSVPPWTQFIYRDSEA